MTQSRNTLSHRMTSLLTTLSTTNINLPKFPQQSTSTDIATNNGRKVKSKSLTDILVSAVIGSALLYNVSITYKMYQLAGSPPPNVIDDEHVIKLSELDHLKPITILEGEKKKIKTDGAGSKSVVDDERSFPPGCSWKCYMNNNPDVIRTFKWSENALIRHYHKMGKLEGRSCGCEIAVLTGPRDAISFSFQNIAGVYSNLTEIPWEWATFETDITKDCEHDNKGLQLAYKNSIENKLHEKGSNVFLGLEDIDRLSKSTNLKSNLDSELENIAKEILSIMPRSAVENGQATVYMIYRSPRIDSLKALWKENFSQRKTFYQFLMSNDLDLSFNDLDVPVFANIMVKEGFKVKMIDISGISRQYHSLIGCEVMGLQCSRDNDRLVMMPIIVSSLESGNEILKQVTKLGKVSLKTDFYNMNVTKRHLEDIDILLNQYDCASLQQLAVSDSVDILYGDALMGRMIECETFDAANFMPREVLIKEIRKVFLNVVGDLIDNILDGKVIQ